MLVEVLVDVLPSVPRTTPPIGAVSKEEPYDGALDAGAGTAASGPATSGEKPSILSYAISEP